MLFETLSTEVYSAPTHVDHYTATTLQRLNLRYGEAAITAKILVTVNAILDKYNAFVHSSEPGNGDIITTSSVHNIKETDIAMAISASPGFVRWVHGPYQGVYRSDSKQVDSVGGHSECLPLEMFELAGYSFRAISVWKDHNTDAGQLYIFIPVKVWRINWSKGKLPGPRITTSQPSDFAS